MLVNFFMYELFGVVGGVLIAISWLPQIFKMVKNKSARDISISFLVIVLLGSLFLTIYSIYINDVVFISLNAAATLNTIAVLFLSLWYNTH